jgi:hypothetical protein
VLLSVLVKADEDISGCEENVVMPLIVAVDVAVPITIDPVPKFEPMVIVAIEEFACNTFTVAVETFKTETSNVVMVPEVACKLLIIPVDTFKTDVFVIED